jgi:hypothetical protein
MRPILILVTACMFVFMCAGLVNAQETTVGGTVKFFLYDSSDGEITYDDETTSSKNGASAGLSQVILNFYREIADDWAVEAQPEIRFSAGATPRLGSEEITRSPSSEAHVEILRAAVIWYMPADYEMKAGYLKPLFCWDYGYELFWDEQYNAYVVSANSWLGSWHDVGVEFYKNFEGEGYAIPAYLYLTNGPTSDVSGQTDDAWTFMFHTAPELMNGNLKFLGSFGYGEYDDDGNNMTRYALGVDYTMAAFNVRGEYLGGTYEKLVSDDVDGEPSGWYVKAFYDVTPTWELMGGYSVTDMNWAGFFFAGAEMDENYTQWTLGANWRPADGVSVMFAYDSIDAERTDPSGDRYPPGDETALKYGRINVGVRATF